VATVLHQVLLALQLPAVVAAAAAVWIASVLAAPAAVVQVRVCRTQ
jgi:hypothetical protein